MFPLQKKITRLQRNNFLQANLNFFSYISCKMLVSARHQDYLFAKQLLKLPGDLAVEQIKIPNIKKCSILRKGISHLITRGIN